MTDQTAAQESKAGRCLQHNWVEERAVLDNDETKIQMQRHGHRGILMMDQNCKVEDVTTVKAVYIPPKSPGVRLRGIRGQLLEKHVAQMIREKVRAALHPPTPQNDFCSTTQKDFCAEGFVPHTPRTTQVHDYKTEQAVTFWSENYQRIQGVTSIQTPKAPFRKSDHFSKPISERLDETELPPDN